MAKSKGLQGDENPSLIIIQFKIAGRIINAVEDTSDDIIEGIIENPIEGIIGDIIERIISNATKSAVQIIEFNNENTALVII